MLPRSQPLPLMKRVSAATLGPSRASRTAPSWSSTAVIGVSSRPGASTVPRVAAFIVTCTRVGGTAAGRTDVRRARDTAAAAASCAMRAMSISSPGATITGCTTTCTASGARDDAAPPGRSARSRSPTSR
jgi:hypothetical protein